VYLGHGWLEHANGQLVGGDGLVQIRKATAKDLPAIHTWRRSWDSGLRRYHRIEPSTGVATFVAVEGIDLCGYGACWSNPIHPDATYFSMYVLPQYRMLGIGKILFYHIAGEASAPLQTAFWDSLIDELNWCRRQGMQDIRHTYLPLLDTKKLNRNLLESHQGWFREHGFRLLPLSNLSSVSDQYERIGELCRVIYTQSHWANPPKHMSNAEWAHLAMDELIIEGSVVVVHEESFVGLGMLHAGDPPELGWRGAIMEDIEVQRHVMAGILMHHVNVLDCLDCSFVTGEFDDTDLWSMMTLQEWPKVDGRMWVTWREP